MSQVTAQRVISGDPEALAALANIHVDKVSIPPLQQPLLASAGPTSSPSSASAPNLDTTDADTPSSSSADGRDSQEGLGGPWRELHPRPPTSLSETTAATSVQSEPDSQSSCCCGPPGESKTVEFDYEVKIPRTLEKPQNATVTSSFQAGGLTQPMDPTSNPNRLTMYHPDDLVHLNTDFSAYELSAGCGMAENADNVPMREQPHSQAACECGDDCECFACMQHPKNRTTLGYVRYHNDLFMREARLPPPPAQQQQQQQLRFGGGDRQQQLSYHPLAAMHLQHAQQFASPFTPSAPSIGDHHGQPVPWPDTAPSGFAAHEQFAFQVGVQGMQLGPDAVAAAYMSPGRPFTSTYAPDHIPAHAPTPAFSVAPEPMQQQQHRWTTATDGPAAAERDVQVDENGSGGGGGGGSGSDYYSPTLSPSAFMLHQYTLPGCDNFYGTCRCGDGCECDGCLTHSGHDGSGPAVAASSDAAPVETAARTTAANGTDANGGWAGLYAERGGAEGAIAPG
jgi:hypothetical protein